MTDGFDRWVAGQITDKMQKGLMGIFMFRGFSAEVERSGSRKIMMKSRNSKGPQMPRSLSTKT
jgi:hypothetical protein